MEENVPKKRGRKKLVDKKLTENKEEITDRTESIETNDKEPEKKKRGRKKKWETTPFKNNYIFENTSDVKFHNDQVIDDEVYNTNNLKFGNLCIKVHDKEQENVNIKDYFVDTKNKNCDIVISSDEEDTCYVKKQDRQRQVNIYQKGVKTEITKSDIKCYYCHNHFNNIPFYLPYEYSTTLDRYKLFGNFCSPNCVKAYCMASKTFDKKTYIIGQFYRKLFGRDFSIKPAPSICLLKDYGGSLTIEEFRKSFYSNKRYTLNNINSKVIYIN
jgi:hypothetical protein